MVIHPVVKSFLSCGGHNTLKSDSLYLDFLAFNPYQTYDRIQSKEKLGLWFFLYHVYFIKYPVYNSFIG